MGRGKYHSCSAQVSQSRACQIGETFPFPFCPLTCFALEQYRERALWEGERGELDLAWSGAQGSGHSQASAVAVPTACQVREGINLLFKASD